MAFLSLRTLACFLLLSSLAAPYTEAITCGQVVSSLNACIPYLRNAGKLTSTCCAGVRNLNTAAKSTADRQTACGCLKSAAGSIPRLNYGLAGSLPGNCGVNIPYKISPSTDCSKVK
ncbi:non-specific lipid-transfer protein 1-like [Aristolochia californica]|uniref:non-specific lipid-transfer protein 1-like n=1 Tax=Aristolochia californica TaxID=171875 RepID=UPI0035E382B1